MCGFTSVNMELPPDEEELGSIDRVDKLGFVLAEATEFGGWKVQGRGGCTPAKKEKKEPPRYGPEVVEGATNLNAQKTTEFAKEVHSKKSGGGRGPHNTG